MMHVCRCAETGEAPYHHNMYVEGPTLLTAYPCVGSGAAASLLYMYGLGPTVTGTWSRAHCPAAPLLEKQQVADRMAG